MERSEAAFGRSKHPALFHSSQDCDSGVVELENGQVVQSDVVVAADGVHSMIRSSVIGFDSPGCFSGEATYRALVRTSEAFKDPVSPR